MSEAAQRLAGPGSLQIGSPHDLYKIDAKRSDASGLFVLPIGRYGVCRAGRDCASRIAENGPSWWVEISQLLCNKPREYWPLYATKRSRDSIRPSRVESSREDEAAWAEARPKADSISLTLADATFNVWLSLAMFGYPWQCLAIPG